MNEFPKHEVKALAPRKGKKQPAAVAVPVVTAPACMDIGMPGMETVLDGIARAISSYAHNSVIGENHLTVSTPYGGEPVQITLADNDYSDTMGRVVTAFERIADSVAKLAGLNRPRLESWHEQDAYTPRYKATAADGGAPGPRK